MQHTGVLELNACLAFLRTGKEISNMDQTLLQDLRWTFVAPRDSTITELFSTSPGDDVWAPSGAEIRADQQRRQREDELERGNTPQPSNRPATTVDNKTKDAPLTQASPPPVMTTRTLDFKKKPVASTFSAKIKPSLLTADLSNLKKGGGVVGAVTSPQNLQANVPSIKLTIYLPNRKAFELRVAKTATVEQAIGAVLERSADKFKGSRKPERYEMRMHDEDGLPNDDYPACDRLNLIADMGETEFCLCEVRREGGASDATEEEEEPTSRPVSPAASSASAAATTNQALPPPSKRSNLTEQNVIRVIFLDKTPHKKRVDPEDPRASTFLRYIVKKEGFPLFAEEYHFALLEEDRERLGFISNVVDPNDDVLSLGVDTLTIRRRRYADAPPEMDLEAAKRDYTQQNNARRNSERRRSNVTMGVLANAQDNNNQAGGPQFKIVDGLEGGGGLGEKKPLQDGKIGTVNASGSKVYKSSGKKGKGLAVTLTDTILLNDVKAAVYEEWPVIKTNNWGKNQKRLMGVDLQKIYNKHRDTHGAFGQSVKHAERLIADVISIDINPNNPAAFAIKFRDGPGNAHTVLNYEAEEGPDEAAKIVAKIKYIQNGLKSRTAI